MSASGSVVDVFEECVPSVGRKVNKGYTVITYSRTILQYYLVTLIHIVCLVRNVFKDRCSCPVRAWKHTTPHVTKGLYGYVCSLGNIRHRMLPC